MASLDDANMTCDRCGSIIEDEVWVLISEDKQVLYVHSKCLSDEEKKDIMANAIIKDKQ